MIHYFPLERLETRYTAHLDDSIVAHLEANGLEHVRYYPEMGGRETQPPAPGSFLNAPSTIEFKARQVAQFAQAVAQARVGPNDQVFLSDLWHPGVIDLAYLSFFERLPLDVRGLLWAGSFTDADIIRGAERWAAPVENTIFDIASTVFVTSRFMRDDVLGKRLLDPAKVVVSYCPLDANLPEPYPEREPIVVFNGRNSPEKQPQLFTELAQRFQGKYVFVDAIRQGYSKQEYYDLLARATVVVSFALEETFGFGALEASALGCVPVVPNRLCYPEFFTGEYLYDGFEDAVAKVQAALTGDLLPPGLPNLLRSMFDKAPQLWFQ